jgi:molecular chaperone Hsp33
LHKFIVAGGLVRGAAVRLDGTWREMLARRSYPPVIQSLLGEMAAGAALMAASIKFNGSLVLQMMGEGGLRVAVAECAPGMALRATAKWSEPVVAESLDGLLGASLPGNHARCVITLDPKDKLPGQQPYQGVVGLLDDADKPFATLAEVLANYMVRSEQIETRFVLACDGDRACGLLVQRMPHEGGAGDKSVLAAAEQAHSSASHAAFEEALMMLATLKAPELLATPPEDLVRKLFTELQLQQWDAADDTGTPHFACSCSRDKVAGMLRLLGTAEVESILSERENVEVACEFCGKQYHFDAVDAAQVFVAAANAQAASSVKQ